MKLVSPLPHRRGRIEIIPLIDIMFFLLAAFMMVSINMIKVKSLKINLPTDVPAAQKENKEDFISISVKEDGSIGFDKDLLTKDALLPKLQALYATNHEQKFLISADQEARHGDVMRVLGKIRAAGFQKVAFSVKPDNQISPDQAAPETLPPDSTTGTPAVPGAPVAPAAPVVPGATTDPSAAGTPAPAPTAPAPAAATPTPAPSTATAPAQAPPGQ